MTDRWALRSGAPGAHGTLSWCDLDEDDEFDEEELDGELWKEEWGDEEAGDAGDAEEEGWDDWD